MKRSLSASEKIYGAAMLFFALLTALSGLGFILSQMKLTDAQRYSTKPQTPYVEVSTDSNGKQTYPESHGLIFGVTDTRSER